MKIEFKEDYLSIKKFNTVNAPNFVVLTGRNGSGKTHLLQAIEKGKVLFNGKFNAEQRIIHFNFFDFCLDDEREYSGETLTKEKNNAWNTFKNWVNSTKMAFDMNRDSEKFEDLCYIARENKIPFSQLTEKEILSESLLLFYLKYKQIINSRMYDFGGRYQFSIFIERLNNILLFPIIDVSEKDFIELYQPYSLKNNFLPEQLGQVIFEYYMKLRNNQFNEFLNEKEGGNRPTKSKDDFVKAHGRAPWEILNEMLKNFNFTDLQVLSPEDKGYFESYRAKLIRKRDGLELDLSSLSSGEKIMMALVASIFKGETDNYFPDILLLDEIDTSLHPSMIKNLLNVIEKVFLSRGVEVILVTHSPTTIALTNDENIYLMNPKGKNRIESSSRSKALSILTEGYMTLDEGVRILDNLGDKEIIIISEGYNSIILKKLLEVHKIENAGVLENIESGSGIEQLKALFDFFIKFIHNKKIVFVWDCDYKKGHELKKENDVTPFVIPENSLNRLAKKGIENAFDESFFDKKFIEDSQYIKRGKVVREDMKFDDNMKKEFALHVLKNATVEDFKNFDSFIDKLKQLSEN